MLHILQENILFVSAISFVLLLVIYSAFYPKTEVPVEKEKSGGKAEKASKAEKGKEKKDKTKAKADAKYKNRFIWWIVYFIIALGVTYGLYILYMKYFKYKMMTGGGGSGTSSKMHYRSDYSNLNMFGDDVDVGFLE